MNHHMRSNPIANMAHQHQQQLLQQRSNAAAQLLLQQQQLLNHHGHLTAAHHQQAPQRAMSNSPHHHIQQQQQQHGHRPPGRPPTNSTGQTNHHQHHQTQQQHHASRNNGPHHPNMAQTQRTTGTHHPPTHHHQQQQHHAQPRSQSSQHHHGHEKQPAQQQQHHNAQVAAAQPAAQQAAVATPPQPPPLPPPLPKGWKREEVVRKRGATSGLVDVVYFEAAQPEKKFRSKLQMQRHFGDKHDVSVLDYRTGKLLQHVYKKHRRMKGLAANPANYTLAAKYDVYLNVPTRQTASIFKQPVNYVTNNVKYNNDPTPAFVTDFAANSAQAVAANQITPNQLAVLSRKPGVGDRARPNQLFWELRFNGSRAVEAAEATADDGFKPFDFDLVNLSKFKNLNISNETALRSVAVSWYLNPNKLLLGQDKEFLRNPRVFIDRDQPLIPALTVKEDDIKHQEKKIKDIRDKIRQAMCDLDAMERDDDDGFGPDEMEENGDDEPESTISTSEVKQEAAETPATLTTTDVEMTKVEPKEEEEREEGEKETVPLKEESNGKTAE